MFVDIGKSRQSKVKSGSAIDVTGSNTGHRKDSTICCSGVSPLPRYCQPQLIISFFKNNSVFLDCLLILILSG
uniref:Uncharacterized protein n=1 Tax=Utricularia reniformis TaxID=192314 RepID=A0A1Y0B037_9LAMI|nr:hypothetical protein AEK19_MT0521 [Utricularia reniformis]ART30777.1 hypothetical protein AEK19_MT0521 [Utricularia reniformis]